MRLEAEGRNLLELAGVSEDSLGFAKAPRDLPTCEWPALAAEPPRGDIISTSGLTGEGLEAQLEALLDDPICKPPSCTSPKPLSEAGVWRQQSNQLRQLPSVLFDDSSWEENDHLNTSELADSLAAMGMSPPRYHTAQHKKATATTAWVHPGFTQFGAAIQRPLG